MMWALLLNDVGLRKSFGTRNYTFAREHTE
jgi:hypothetical protein